MALWFMVGWDIHLSHSVFTSSILDTEVRFVIMTLDILNPSWTSLTGVVHLHRASLHGHQVGDFTPDEVLHIKRRMVPML